MQDRAVAVGLKNQSEIKKTEINDCGEKFHLWIFITALNNISLNYEVKNSSLF